jgi:hypothetical protein
MYCFRKSNGIVRRRQQRLVHDSHLPTGWIPPFGETRRSPPIERYMPRRDFGRKTSMMVYSFSTWEREKNCLFEGI